MVPGCLHSSFQPEAQFFGHLFSGRYKALIVDGSGSGYLKSVCDYVQRLRMGTRGHVTHLLYLRQRRPAAPSAQHQPALL